MPGIWELIIVLAIVLVLFGAGKLKNISSDLGDALRNFKEASKPKRGNKEKIVKKKK